MREDRVLQWFEDLEDQFTRNESLQRALSARGGYVEQELWVGWATSCESLIGLAYGPRSLYGERFGDAREECEMESKVHAVRKMHALFWSPKNDYLKDYAGIELQISGDILGDFVALAKEALNAGHVEVASVLASSALEDALKRYAIANGIDAGDSTMDKVISALKSKGLIKGGTSKALQPMPTIRNYALHANWDKLSPVEIGSLIGFLEAFLIRHFQADER